MNAAARCTILPALLAASLLPGLSTAQELLIRGATVHTSSPRGTIKDGDVLVRNGRIAEVGTGLAATPGTSNHGWGMSLDLDLDDEAQQWMRTNGPDYGFVEDVPREPWHWTYRPASRSSVS